MNADQQATHDFTLHQDALAWSRAQYLIAIQSAMLAGLYGVKDDLPASIGLLVLGFLLTGLIFILMKRDEVQRDAAFKQLGLSEVAADYPRYAQFRGRRIILVIFGILLIADVLLFTYLQWPK